MSSVGRLPGDAALLCMALGMAVLVSAPAGAADDRSRAQELVRDATNEFQAGRYDRARDRFLAAYQIFKSPRILFDLGQTELKLEHDREAATYFYEFNQQPEAGAPVEESHRQAAAALTRLEARLGRLQLQTDAPEARRTVDGEAVTDEVIYVAPGAHTVVAAAEGRSQEVHVVVAAGQLQTVSLARADLVAPNRTHLAVHTEPPGAAIRVDDVEQGAAPTIADVAAGDHRVEARLAGYRDATQSVTAVAGTTQRVDLTLVSRGANSDGLAATGTGPEAAAPAESSRLWTWVAAGVAGAAAVGGISFGLSAERASNVLRAGSSNQALANARLQTAQNRQLAANVCWIGAGVSAAGAVGLFFLEGSF